MTVSVQAKLNQVQQLLSLGKTPAGKEVIYCHCGHFCPAGETHIVLKYLKETNQPVGNKAVVCQRKGCQTQYQR